MSRFARKTLLFLSAVVVPATAVSAQHRRPADRAVRLRNDLTEDRLSTYRLTRTIRRTSTVRGAVETLAFRQSAEWVRYQMEETRPGSVRLAQMIVDRPASVAAYLVGEKAVAPLPGPERFNLPGASARLLTDVMSGTVSPPLAPATEAAQRALLAAMLDVARWPNGEKRAGDRWQHDVSNEGFHGSQSIELLEVVHARQGTVVKLRATIEGEFIGPLAKSSCRFGSAASEIQWLLVDRQLRSLRGQASWRRGEGAEKQEFDMKADLQLAETHVAPQEAAGALRAQLVDFGKIIEARNQGAAEGRKACESFRSRWPDSLWKPAVEQLANVQQERAAVAPLADAALRDLLVKNLAEWQAAVSKDDRDLQSRAGEAFTKLANEQRPGVIRMLTGEDANMRAVAAFALAFGTSRSNLGRLQHAARDASPLVRAWAAYGLAIRKGPDTDAELLAALLRDADDRVRLRAVQAVTACAAMDSAGMPGLRSRIVKLLLEDRADFVRFQAAQSLGQIGTPAESAALQKALRREVDGALRNRIQQSIDQIEKRRA